ncbi:MAG: YbfB/YjiJ family MFS transporter, partial [Candidatus Velthaea sp.]
PLVLSAVKAPLRGSAGAWLFAGLGFGVIGCGIGAPFADGPHAWRIAHLAMAAFTAAGAYGLTHVADSGSPAAGSARYDVRGLLDPRGMLFLIAAYAAFGFGYISYATFAGALLAARHATHLQTGIAWIAFGGAAVVGSLLAGRLLGSRFARYALAAISLCAGTGCAISAFGGAAGETNARAYEVYGYAFLGRRPDVIIHNVQPTRRR